MALDALTSFKSQYTETLDITEGARVTHRAILRGTVATSNGESDNDIRVSGAIPRKFDLFPDNPNLRCVNVDIKRMGPVLVEWEAQYEWKTTEIDETGIDPGDTPLNWSIRRATRKSQTQIDRDINGYPIMTVTKESPNPPLPDEICDVAYIFSANGRLWNPSFLASYEDAINSDVFMGTPIGQCKIDDIQADVTFHTDKPPEMNISITVLVGRAPPAANMYELNGSGAWVAITQPAVYYTWHKRWRAEGLKQLQSGTPVEANGPGEAPIPRLHSIATGALITSVNDAQWYTHRTKPLLPFNTLFNSV